MLESITDLKTFLTDKTEEASTHENWMIKGYKLNPEIVGSEGYILEGLHQMSSDDIDALRDTLCVKGEPEKHTIFLVVNLDKSDKSAEELALSALRWQSFIEHDAILMISGSDDRVIEAEKQLRDTAVLSNDAVILTRLG